MGLGVFMTDLNQGISSVFSATQLILVFVAILFNIFYLETKRSIYKKIPRDEFEHEEYFNYLNSSLKPMCYILFILFISLFLIFFIPITIQIVVQSVSQLTNFNFSNWYDITRISFLFITILIFIFVYLTYQLNDQLKDRIKHVKEKLENKKKNS